MTKEQLEKVKTLIERMGKLAAFTAVAAKYMKDPKGEAIDTLKNSLKMFAAAIRFDLPRGLRISHLLPWVKGKDPCSESFLDDIRVSRAALYFATGKLNGPI